MGCRATVVSQSQSNPDHANVCAMFPADPSRPRTSLIHSSESMLYVASIGEEPQVWSIVDYPAKAMGIATGW